ncbi:GTP 3',8-cyclase [Zhongshania aliphaticivorans]|uniref:GTP 3',8-cyclase n=1 Tax=Zhongshania aliphaticivorans TaxID=1470434 RepID=A0A5S9PHV7_9GAMM|nr:GTP 3',8-cyclase MoaA [Zhongshania aliphaticivorans]CAA0103679.1 GTP 3',8-cyclase [Zhongshania aliphaticivorans]CAA0113346.1 GTP 3',8-cyclase [Zhongshania aliphaticivorans]
MINADNTLQDRFGRGVEYLRLSVTDRCDFRCVYCMAEDMTFLPRNQILSLEQLFDIAHSFVQLGVKKIRLTGGEPLVRNNVISLIERLGQLEQLEQLHLTTNGAQLDKFAAPLKAAGLTGMNISLDSLQPERFKALTRFGDLKKVLSGIDAARDAGFNRIKLNAVILKGRNDDEILDLVDFVRDKHIDISFIEEMPLGHISEHDRALSFISSEQIRNTIESRHSLTPTTENTGGPSRYYRMSDSTSRIGFISPHSHNFCHLCNRVRLTVEGRLLLCLGNEHSVSLKEIVDRYPGDELKLREAIIQAMDLKPERHHFSLDDEPQIVRFMNTTGG